jgi:hypothetical protein
MKALNSFLSYLKHLLGPKKTIEQCLEELVKNANKEDYTVYRNFQGQKLETESLRLVWSKKDHP